MGLLTAVICGPEPRPRHLDTILDMIPRHLDTLASTITRHTDTIRCVSLSRCQVSTPSTPSTHLDTPRHTLTHPRSATDPFPSRTLHLHFRVSAHKCAPLCSGDDAWIHTNPPQGTGIDIVCSAHGAHVPHDGRSTQAGVAYVHCGKLTATRMQPEAPVWICCRGARLVSYVQSTAKLEMVQKASTF